MVTMTLRYNNNHVYS